jgi:predicted enzyme related to lactoylglutathione lyase
MPVTHVFAAIFVSDYDAAVLWYERLLGAPPTMRPNSIEAAWDLAGSGWVYVQADPERAGRSRVTLLVDDLDERVAGIAERGVATHEIEEQPGLFRRAEITDPDGNTVQIAQPLSSG